jgi:hypothetical protein
LRIEAVSLRCGLSLIYGLLNSTKKRSMNEGLVLLLHSADRNGPVSPYREFLFSHGGNILHVDQH